MAYTPPSAGEVPSAVYQKVLACGKDRSTRMGELGFSTNFTDINDIASMHQGLPVLSEEDSLYAVDESSLAESMGETHQAYVEHLKNSKWMRNNPTSAALAETHITQKLEEHGVPKVQLDKSDLRMKVKALIELSNPRNPQNFVIVMMQEPGKLEAASIPTSATFAQGQIILHDLAKAASLARCNKTGEDTSAFNKHRITWKYTMVGRGGRPMSSSSQGVVLNNEADWRFMMRQVTGKDKPGVKEEERPVLVLERSDQKSRA